MEHILTVTGCSQLMLCLWAADRMATAPTLIFGLTVFGLIVQAVRQILQERSPAKRRGPAGRKVTRIL
jgi:hypothetical protein